MKDIKSINPLYFLWGDFFNNDKNKNSIRQVLKENILFKTLNSREIAYLEKNVHVREYQPNEMVFKQNEKGIGMYVIANGTVAVRVHSMDIGDERIKTEDTEITVALLKKGSFFGELALIENENKRTASIYANEYTTLIGLFQPDLFEIMEKRPAMGIKIMFQISKILARRLTETTERIKDLKKELTILETKTETNIKDAIEDSK